MHEAQQNYSACVVCSRISNQDTLAIMLQRYLMRYRRTDMVRYTTYFQRESVSLKKNDPLFIWGFPRSEVNTYFSMHNLRSASKRPWIRYWRPEGTRPWHYLTSPQLRKSSWKEPCLEIKTSSTGYYRQT